jgi:hypothetical protein
MGANSVPRNSMKPSGYWCAARVWATSSVGSRLMLAMVLMPRSSKPSAPARAGARSRAHLVQAEAGVEQADEGADRAGGVVVLGLAQQQRAAALDVAQVDVVAQAGADDVAAAVDGQHHLGLGVVPGRVGADADVRARPTEASTGALVNTSASGPMPTSRYCDHRPAAAAGP